MLSRWRYRLGRGLLRRLHRLGDEDARESGSAVVEFVMIVVLLMFLLFAVLQVAVYFYIRNIVQAGAAAGARYASNQGVDYGAGGTRAMTLVRQGSSPAIAGSLPCQGSAGTDVGGLPLAVVHCGGHVKSIFLPLGRVLEIDVTARVLKEGQP